MERMSYWTRVGSVLSQAINALVFNGHPDMSLSTRAYLERAHWFWSWVYGLADAIFGEGHCRASLASDLRFADDIRHLAEHIQ